MKEVDNIKDEEVNEDNVEEGNLEEDMTAKNSGLREDGQVIKT